MNSGSIRNTPKEYENISLHGFHYLCRPTIKIYILFIYLFTSFFWTQAYQEGMCTNETQDPCEVPSLLNPKTHKGWPHHPGAATPTPFE